VSFGLVYGKDNLCIPNIVLCEAEINDDFGLFKLTHKYDIDTDDLTVAKFVFPIEDNIEIVSFNAKINETIIKSQFIKKPYVIDDTSFFSYSNYNGLNINLGEVLPNDKVEIEITFVMQIMSDGEKHHIVIPTGVSPKFLFFDEQLPLDSMFEDIEYNMNLKIKYRNYNIKKVESSNYNILTEYGVNFVDIFMNDCKSTEKNIIIDIFTDNRNNKFFSYNNYYSCSFVPSLDIYEDTPRNYMFILDLSTDLNNIKMQQVKSALNLCIRALKDGDKFNISTTQSQNTFFSYEYQPLNDDTLLSATRWIEKYKNEGSPEFYSPLRQIYEMTDENAIAVFISDGRISGNSVILNYIDENKNKIKFYNFGFDVAMNQDFLNELSALTGGKTKLISQNERIDDTIIKGFNIIVAPSIDNAAIFFDNSVCDVTSSKFKKIHCGETVNVMFKSNATPPKKVFVKGYVGGKEIVSETDIEEVIECGKELEYKFGYETIQNLYKKRFYTEEKLTVENSIIANSQKYSINSRYTMLHISDDTNRIASQCYIDKSNDNLFGWFKTAFGKFYTTLQHTGEEIKYIEIIKQQRANGRFIPSTREEEAIVLYTAQVVGDVCINFPNPNMFKWQMRKAVLFLLDFIENTEEAEISPIIINALNVWHNKLGADDYASQKIEVLSFLHPNM